MESTRYYIGPMMIATGITGILLGGTWVWLGASTFVMLTVLDALMPDDEKTRSMNGAFADLPIYLSLVLAFAMYGTLAWRIGLGGLTWGQTTGAIISTGWLMVVPILPVVHELFHRRSPFVRTVGIYGQILYMDPTRDIGHLLMHHIDVATPNDADTPRRGEIIYPFIVRVTLANYLRAYRSEREAAAKKGISVWSPRGRLAKTFITVVAFMSVIWLIGGFAAVGAAFAAGFFAKVLVEGFNYFQHYGLVRVEGKPITINHSWNHLSPMVRAAGFEITSHNMHHEDSYRPYHQLTPAITGPRMPSIFICFAAALIPPLWFSFIAKPKLQRWDADFATPEEQKLAREANSDAGWPDWLGDGLTAMSPAE